MPDLPADAPLEIIAATTAATAVPTPGFAGNLGLVAREAARIRVFFVYAGTVNTCVARIWFRDRALGTWYEGATTDDIDPLTPGGASPVNEARDWIVGLGAEVFFQIVSITGGGSVTVRAQGVRS